MSLQTERQSRDHSTTRPGDPWRHLWLISPSRSAIPESQRRTRMNSIPTSFENQQSPGSSPIANASHKVCTLSIARRHPRPRLQQIRRIQPSGNHHITSESSHARSTFRKASGSSTVSSHSVGGFPVPFRYWSAISSSADLRCRPQNTTRLD